MKKKRKITVETNEREGGKIKDKGKLAERRSAVSRGRIERDGG